MPKISSTNGQCLIDVSRLSRSEYKLFRATCDRVNKIAARTGRQFAVFPDAIFVMDRCSRRLWPKMRWQRRIQIHVACLKFLSEAVQVSKSEPAGHA